MANGTDNVNPAPQIVDVPDPQISGQQAGQDFDQVGEKPADLSALLSHPDFEALLEKKVQSVKDVRFGKMGTEIKDLRTALSKYDSLVASGLSKEQAKAQLEGEGELQSLRDRLAVLEGKDIGVTSAGAGAEPWGVRQDELLESAGLKKTDPRAVELAKSKPNWTVDEWLSELNDKSLEWRNADLNKPQPSSASVAQTTASIPSGSGEYTAASYGEAMLAASGNKAELNRIKARARADGVDVDNIGFA